MCFKIFFNRNWGEKAGVSCLLTGHLSLLITMTLSEGMELGKHLFLHSGMLGKKQSSPFLNLHFNDVKNIFFYNVIILCLLDCTKWELVMLAHPYGFTTSNVKLPLLENILRMEKVSFGAHLKYLFLKKKKKKGELIWFNFSGCYYIH